MKFEADSVKNPSLKKGKDIRQKHEFKKNNLKIR